MERLQLRYPERIKSTSVPSRYRNLIVVTHLLYRSWYLQQRPTHSFTMTSPIAMIFSQHFIEVGCQLFLVLERSKSRSCSTWVTTGAPGSLEMLPLGLKEHDGPQMASNIGPNLLKMASANQNWHHPHGRSTATAVIITTNRRGGVVSFFGPPHLELRVTVHCFTTAHSQDRFFPAFLPRHTKLACPSAPFTSDIDALADEAEGSLKLTSNRLRSCGPSLVGDRHRRWHKVGCRL